MKEIELQATIDNLKEIILQKDIQIKQLQEENEELRNYKRIYCNT